MDKHENQLAKQVALLQATIDALPFDIWCKDEEGRYLLVNQSFEQYAGKTKEEILGKKDHDLFPEEEADEYVAGDKATLTGNLAGYHEIDMKNGTYKEEHKRLCIIDKDMRGIAGCNRDITDRILATQCLEQSEERFRTIFEKSQIGIGIYDSVTGIALHVNDRLVEILGRPRHELLSCDWKEYSHEEDIPENLEKTKLLREGIIDRFSIDKRYVRPDGSIAWINLIVTPYTAEENKTQCHLCMIYDITAQKKAEEANRYLNYHDQLTGLYNRRFYDEELVRLDQAYNLPITLVMADVNGLKLTNDAFGHLEGDQMLQRISAIMQSQCRAEDVIARIGGDEFILLLPQTTYQEAEQVMNRIQNALKQDKTNHFICSVSFGQATKEKEGESIKEIYMIAEDRMYREKLTESRSMRYETIRIVRETLFQKNKREQMHCERVSRLCQALGEAMGFNLSDVLELKTAGLLHDIGKIGVEESLLNKTEKLTPAEWEEVKRHAEIGYHILTSASEFAGIAEYVLCHHERIDGTGYPRNLPASKIPIQSKIISIADAYDAMTRLRTYRNIMSKEEAVLEIQKNAGTQFDPEIARIFIKEVLGCS